MTRESGTSTTVEEEVSAEEKTSLTSPWKVVVFDDPVTLMSYVTMVFRRTFGYSEAKAHGLMMTVHKSGRAVVWTGAREPAELYLQQLHSHQLLAGMEES